MCVCIYVYIFFLYLNFFPFSLPGPHFAEFLHWDVTEDCEVRLVCKVRNRFQPGESETPILVAVETVREQLRSGHTGGEAWGVGLGAGGTQTFSLVCDLCQQITGVTERRFK